MNVWLAVFLGGGLGAMSRYGVGRLAMGWLPTNFPYGTLAANVLSAAVLGWVLFEVDRRDLGGVWATFLAVGFCGGFSTFSTFSYETMELMAQGRLWTALLNVFVSVTVCVLILYFLSKRILP